MALVLLAIFINGCSTELKPEDDTNYYGSLPDSLIGKWSTSYDYYEIKRDVDGTETVKYYMDGGDTYDAFESTGTIMFVSNYDSKSGVIIIKYTDPDYYAEKLKPFHAYYYLNFIPGTSVELYDTWDATADDWDADTYTLSEAVRKFTSGKMGNYSDISFHPVYSKE